MAEIPYGKVARRTWDRENFRTLSERHRLMLLYIWTGKQGETSPIIHSFSIGEMAETLNIGFDETKKVFYELLADGWFQYDHENRIIFLPKQIKFDPPCNQNSVKSMIKRAKELEMNGLRNGFLTVIEPFAQRFAIPLPEPLGEPLPYGYASPEPEPHPKPEDNSSTETVVDNSQKKTIPSPPPFEVGHRTDKTSLNNFREWRRSEYAQYHVGTLAVLYGETFVRVQIDALEKWLAAHPGENRGDWLGWLNTCLGNAYQKKQERDKRRPAPITEQQENAHYRSHDRSGDSSIDTGFSKIGDAI